MSIEKNLIEIQQNITKAMEKAGRSKESLKIVAVSKTVSEERILETYHLGQRIFGENRVQEWDRKHRVLPADCEWHIIGRLQTNKVKYLDQHVALIHSLDRLNLLTKLDQEGKERNILWKTLLQVNVAEDEAKAGLEIEEVEDFLETAKSCSNVKIKGLMTIGALDAGPEETRGFFRKLREIRDTLIRKGIYKREDFWELSMGMSQDYLLAIEEGATMIRIGSIIFGQRNSNDESNENFLEQ
ncbi:MAG: YggS family pyridoxal phosphate-dependent enzyme [Peptococcaceae bacterium]|nr:YggS family pyridoxal phosphate-dependent enzyme [Peptococcaceae bacterium]